MNKLVFILLFLSLSSVINAQDNFELEVSRRLVNNFTDALLKKKFQEIDTLVFDVSESQIQIKFVGHKKRFEVKVPALKRIAPLHRPGEVFSSSGFSDASSEDEEDFLIGLQINLSLKMAEGAVDTVILGFELPSLAMYYKQDFKKYLSLLHERNRRQISYDALSSRLNGMKERLKSLGSTVSKELISLRLDQSNLLKNRKLLRSLIHGINLRLIRFTSGSEIKVTASDHLVENLFDMISERGILSNFLDIQLISILDGHGKIRVSNLSKALSPYAPGLKMTDIRVIAGEKEDGEGVGNHRILLKGKFFE
ncbi:hypothetical protein MJH12_08390 [bacterium]|nr:hypothetical protein [bacterium]